MTQTNNHEEIVSTREAAMILGLSLSSVYKMTNNGDLPYVKEKNTLWIRKEDLKELVDKRNGYGLSVPSQDIYPYMHIINLIKMVRNFSTRYDGNTKYSLIFDFEKMLESSFERFIEYSEEGRNTSFTGNKINTFLQEVRKKAQRDEGNKDIWMFIAFEMQRIFSTPLSLGERNMQYTQLLIDVGLQLASQQSSLKIFIPEEE